MENNKEYKALQDEYWVNIQKEAQGYLEKVKQDGSELKFIPEDFINEELCYVAVKQAGRALAYVPKEYINEELCEIAVTNKGNAIMWVPEEFKTYNVCYLACNDLSIKKGDDVLEFAILSEMPEEFHEKLCEDFGLEYEKEEKLSNTKYEDFDLNDSKTWDKFTFEEQVIIADDPDDDEYGYVLRKDLNGSNIYNAIIIRFNERENPQIVDNFEAEYENLEQAIEATEHYIYQNYDMDYVREVEAVKQNGGEYLQYVPDYFRTKELCELAVKDWAYALESVPEELRTKELCEIAITQEGCGQTLEFVPNHLKSQELCEVAVTNDFTGNALRYVPEDYKTFELCDTSVKNEDYGCLHSFESMPEEFQKELAEKYDVKLPEKGKDR